MRLYISIKNYDLAYYNILANHEFYKINVCAKISLNFMQFFYKINNDWYILLILKMNDAILYFFKKCLFYKQFLSLFL